MKISKRDALEWIEFLSSLPGDKKEVVERYETVIGSIFRQIELSVNDNFKKQMEEIPNLKNLKGRTQFVGDKD
ncbi:MAG: radical SAM protein, partial [Fusobacteriaceae bacterium]